MFAFMVFRSIGTIMKKLILLIALLALLLPTVSISKTLEPPWKLVDKTSEWEYWYNPSDVATRQSLIGTKVWEIYPGGVTKRREIFFDWDTGKVSYGTCEGYKFGKLITKIEGSAHFEKPKSFEKKVFNLLKSANKRPSLKDDADADAKTKAADQAEAATKAAVAAAAEADVEERSKKEGIRGFVGFIFFWGKIVVEILAVLMLLVMVLGAFLTRKSKV